MHREPQCKHMRRFFRTTSPQTGVLRCFLKRVSHVFLHVLETLAESHAQQLWRARVRAHACACTPHSASEHLESTLPNPIWSCPSALTACLGGPQPKLAMKFGTVQRSCHRRRQTCCQLTPGRTGPLLLSASPAGCNRHPRSPLRCLCVS